MTTPSATSSESEAGGLRRDLTLPDAVGVGLGAVVGAGLFVVTGEAARIAGIDILWALAIAGTAAACNALSSARLAAAMPHAGGAYEYGTRLLGPWVGRVAGWCFLFSKLAAGGVVAAALGHGAESLFPWLPWRIAAGAIVALLILANLMGIRKAGWLNLGIVTVVVLALLLFAATAFATPHPLISLWPNLFGALSGSRLSSILQASALLFFAYTGYARVATLAGEVAEPERTIPRAITLTIVLAVALYLIVVTAALAVIGPDGVGASGTPIESAASTLSQWLGIAVGGAARLALLGVLLSQLLGISRVAWAMALRGDLPNMLAHLSSRAAVPDRAIFLSGVIVLLIALGGSAGEIAAAASFSILLYYAIANAAAVRLAPRAQRWGRAVAVAGFCICLLLAVWVPWTTVVASLAFLLFALAVRLISLKVRIKMS